MSSTMKRQLIALSLLTLGACGDSKPSADAGAGSDSMAPAAALLSALDTRVLALTPLFDPMVTSYSVDAEFFVDQLVLTATADSANVIRLNGSLLNSAEPADPVPLALGASSATIEVASPGLTTTTYTIDITRGRGVLDYVKPNIVGTLDEFGYSIAMDGDLLAIGARFESSATTTINGDQTDSSQASTGAVYVFARGADGVWTEEAYIKASVNDAFDEFGAVVALSGDTLSVAAPRERSAATGVNGNALDNTALGAGAVYVFVRSGTTWTQQAYIKASNTEPGDLFGQDMALSGDTLAVSAPNEDSVATGVNGNEQDNTAPSAGAVYVFARSGTTWNQQAYIKGSNTEADDSLSTVDISGDTLVVGAQREDSSATGINGNEGNSVPLANSGAAYVFVRAGGVWTQQAYIKASNTGAADLFGWDVAVDGDTVVITTPFEQSLDGGNQANDSGNRVGAAYVFTRTGTTWTQQAYLKADNLESDDDFAYSVDIEGDRIVLAADREGGGITGLEGDQSDNSSPGTGAVYVFTRIDGVWHQSTYIKPSTIAIDDNFSRSLAISGGTIVVGAPLEDSAASGLNGDQTDNTLNKSGAAFLFE